jgi:excisionase family DNA binding protein
MLTLSEVARCLRVHPSTIYRLVKDNALQGFKVGRDWRFSVEEIDKVVRVQDTLGGHKRNSEPISSEPPHANLSDPPRTTAGMKPDDIGPPRLPEAQLKKVETEVIVADEGRAPEDPNGTSSDAPSRESALVETQVSRLRQLEEQNRRLKGIVADQALEIQVLKEVAKGRLGRR